MSNSGTIPSPAEIAQFQALQKLVDPGRSLTQLDAFGKWLFLSVSVVGLLGAAFGGASLAGLQAWGRVAYFTAAALVGFSLGLAAIGTGPIAKLVNPNSPDRLALSVYGEISRRGWCLRGSAWLFAAALVCASLAPLLSRLTLASRVDVGYSILKDSLSAEIGGRGLRPGTIVAAALRFADADSTILVVQGRQVASDSGKLSLKLAAPVPLASVEASILVTCPGGSGGCVASSVQVPLRKAAPPAAAAGRGGRSPSRRR